MTPEQLEKILDFFKNTVEPSANKLWVIATKEVAFLRAWDFFWFVFFIILICVSVLVFLSLRAKWKRLEEEDREKNEHWCHCIDFDDERAAAWWVLGGIVAVSVCIIIMNGGMLLEYLVNPDYQYVRMIVHMLSPR